MGRLAFIVVLAFACDSRGRLEPMARDLPHLGELPFEMLAAAPGRLDPFATWPAPGYEPLALATASIGRVRNVDANIPPLCYTASERGANPCWACHTRSKFPNLADDWELQMNYSFPPTAQVNPWRNLFRARSTRVRLSDEELLAYIRVDNYRPLAAALAARASFPGWRPDLDLAAGFDAAGFALDGSGWRAIRYKPFPGTFWPTNGSADDVYIRLPIAFRRDASGAPSNAIYRANLAILEAAIASDLDLVREVEPIDERIAGTDLDGDGVLGVATTIRGLPATFVGEAARIPVTRQLYPRGVELAHTVRYVDPDAPGGAARRLKELRYSRKVAVLDDASIVAAYDALEAPDAGPPYRGTPLTGMHNGFGWMLQGWIEDRSGWLRLQTQEETQFCMGCHTGLGVTIDQTFALARKVPGAAGWRMQDPRGIPDVPQRGSDRPEYALYLERARAGDELRANDEMLARFFVDGEVDRAAVAATCDDIAKLIVPSRGRALALDRAYLVNVVEQSYVWGRDAIVEPVATVRARIDERSTGIGEAQRVVRDGRLQLDWNR